MQISFFKPSVGAEEISAVTKIMESWMIVEGQEVRKLEEDFSQFITNGRYHPICVTNGTVALDLALRSLDVTEDDEIIVPDFTFIATANVVRFQNATVKFADVDIQTYNVTLEEIKKQFTPKTKAIIVVHLFWNPVSDIQEISDFCKEHDIYLIEDCAQAHWAKIHWKHVWSFGDISCFSFYATKNMWTAEGWITLFRNETSYKKWKLYYNHWQSEKYLHDALGHNFRMTNIHAAIWNVQLKRLPSFNTQRNENAVLYKSILSEQNVLQLPTIVPESYHVFHQYTVLVKKDSGITRKEIQSKLMEKWIPTTIHYPIPIHKQPYYKNLWYGDQVLSKTEYLCENIFSLPIYPGLKKEEIEYIGNSLLEIIK